MFTNPLLMLTAIRRAVRTWPLWQGLHASTSRERRHWLLKAALVMLTACALVFYGAEQTEYDHRIHLGVACVYVLLFVVLQAGAPYAVTAHLGFLISLVHVLGVSAMTGGINATAMVWLTVLTLPIIMLLGRKAALYWSGLALAANLVMLVLTQNGVLDGLKRMDNEVLVWTLMNKVLVVCLALGMVYVADYAHRQQSLALDESNQALEKTHIALRQAQSHKDEFIASVGHELRTPMNAILGLNGLLRSELSSRPEDVEIVDHIRRSTEQLLHVVNDILDFSQFQAGRLVLVEQPFALLEAVQEVLDLYRDKVAAKSLGLRLDAQVAQDMWVKGDRQRLVQILQHLLDNAVKFTESGHIQVRMKTVGLGVRFEVEDTGIGISFERQQQVFDSFEFADLQTNRQYGGTGLGLSICERLVSLQGGRIGVSSVPGQGAMFWFELPLPMTAAPVHQNSHEQVQSMRSRPMRLLLVDDNAVNLMVARLMLKKTFRHADIVEATGGAQALELLQSKPFDLVLMDMVMPGVDGLEATKTLRRQFAPPLCDLPVLGLTASTHPLDHDKCLAAGMNDVLHKPLDEAQVLAQITRILIRDAGGDK